MRKIKKIKRKEVIKMKKNETYSKSSTKNSKNESWNQFAKDAGKQLFINGSMIIISKLADEIFDSDKKGK